MIALRWVSPSALPRSPTHPVTNQFVFGYGRWPGLEDSYEAAPLQHPNGLLHCRLGQAGRIGQFLQAPRNTSLLLTIECSPEDDINQKSGGSVIVTRQIGQKYVHDVLVNRDVLHGTIA